MIVLKAGLLSLDGGIVVSTRRTPVNLITSALQQQQSYPKNLVSTHNWFLNYHDSTISETTLHSHLTHKLLYNLAAPLHPYPSTSASSTPLDAEGELIQSINVHSVRQYVNQLINQSTHQPITRTCDSTIQRRNHAQCIDSNLLLTPSCVTHALCAAHNCVIGVVIGVGECKTLARVRDALVWWTAAEKKREGGREGEGKCGGW